MNDNIGKYEFILASDDREFSIAKELFIEYANSLNFNLCFQNFENELIELNSMYNRPCGGIILIKEIDSGEFVGCVGIRKSEQQIAELKRMYVKESHRHKGLGEHLLNRAINLAKQLNYTKIRLDTMESMKSAVKLYRSKGFNPIESYRYNPVKNVLFFELIL
ncbi:MAG: GNAT family N-acetyltransferase [Bacteroidales bacterium]|jgi:ribosomal protein S18 acetylase RimI-like enzyme|nr:GNAT family N-acetyltransferase [Bacteroidales bacterium]